MLAQEYKLRRAMDSFEKEQKKMISKLSKFSTVDFVHEEFDLWQEIG